METRLQQVVLADFHCFHYLTCYATGCDYTLRVMTILEAEKSMFPKKFE
jgi:hypothetical protein